MKEPSLADSPLRRHTQTALLTLVAVALTLVVIAPAILSSSDILRWATSPDGLHLDDRLAWLTFIALDAAAVVCVGMSTFAAARGESGAVFRALTWAFAAGSALANYRFGLTTPAPDDQVFFPAMSLAGPLLLEVMLNRVRTWRREAEGVQHGGRPRFGLRWIIAFGETRRAWTAAVREGIPRADDAVAFVREAKQLAALPPGDQVLMAWQALGTTDVSAARRWLSARGVTVVTNAAVQMARSALTGPPTTSASTTTVSVSAPRQTARRALAPAPGVNDLGAALALLSGKARRSGATATDERPGHRPGGYDGDRPVVHQVRSVGRSA